MRATFGDVDTVFPDGWIDGSIIKVSAPGQPGEGEAHPSLVITRAKDEGEPLPGIIEAHADQLANTLIGFESKGTGKIPGQHGEVHFMEHRFGLEGEFSQILLMTVAGPTIFIVTGTAGTADYPSLRDGFIKAATALKTRNTFSV